jgi:hypothetical protein
MTTVREELHAFLLSMKARRLDAGEVVGETCSELLITAHLVALKIGIERSDIIAHLDVMIARLAEDMN